MSQKKLIVDCNLVFATYTLVSFSSGSGVAIVAEEDEAAFPLNFTLVTGSRFSFELISL